MNADKKKLIINTLITLGIGLVVTFLIVLLMGIFDSEEPLRILCDGFTISGLFILGIALLGIIGQKGEYDALSYIAHTITPFKKVKYINYSEYKDAKIKKREESPKSKPKHMFIAGGVLVLTAIILIIIYYI